MILAETEDRAFVLVWCELWLACTLQGSAWIVIRLNSLPSKIKVALEKEDLKTVWWFKQFFSIFENLVPSNKISVCLFHNNFQVWVEKLHFPSIALLRYLGDYFREEDFSFDIIFVSFTVWREHISH